MTTRYTVVADGSTRDFTVPFPYIDKTHVVVTVNDIVQPLSAFSWTSPSSIQFPSNIVAGSTVFLRRATPSDPLVEYTTGSVLPVADLDVDSRQALYRAEELEDVFDRTIHLPDGYANVYPDLELPPPAASNLIGWNYDGSGLRNIDPTSLGTPGDPTLRADLADPTGGAALVAFKRAEAGALARTSKQKLAEFITPEDFGAVGDGVIDDCAAIDNALLALKAKGGGTLYFAPGKTYMLSSVRYGTGTALCCPSNVTIIAYGATIRMGANLSVMMRNDSDGTVGGYSANRDIRIHGGTWDPNYPTFTGGMAIGFTHTNSLLVRDARILNGGAGHHIEVNACSNVLIEGCTFEGGAEIDDANMEAVQIDGAISSGTWGTGPYDNTFCSNVKVVNNTFINCGSGVGTHSSVAGKQHNLIVVANNVFSSCYYYGVRALNWQNASIIGNRFFGGAVGVQVAAANDMINEGISVSGNVFTSVGLSDAAGAGNGHAIYFFGNASGTEQNTAYAICNNAIHDCAFATSGAGIKVNYCPGGVINGNVIDNVQGSGISVFGNGDMTISGNRVKNVGAYGISAQSLGSAAITDNVVGKLNYVSITTSLITGNIISSVGGLTSSGTNTNTTAIHNLVNTTFA